MASSTSRAARSLTAFDFADQLGLAELTLQLSPSKYASSAAWLS